jgi:hypothetical protein
MPQQAKVALILFAIAAVLAMILWHVMTPP